jgi:serine/threonine protein kinase
MPATLIQLGDAPPTLGGDAERAVVSQLVEELSDRFVVVSNLSLETRGDYREYDVVVMTASLCEVLEVKHSPGPVTVYEDRIEAMDGFSFDRVFSKLESKIRILKKRLLAAPFRLDEQEWIRGRVLLGPGCGSVRFDDEEHRQNRKVMTCGEAVNYYKQKEQEIAGRLSPQEFRHGWQERRNAWLTFKERVEPSKWTRHRLGRFQQLRTIASGPPREYLAVDEAPCRIEVHLKEFPYNPTAQPAELEAYLERVAREMKALRRVRHQYITCVTGHFRTGHSLVQVSDWFDGRSISERWSDLAHLSLTDRLSLMVKLAQGLGFCHLKGVFHRNLDASQVLVDENFDDLRISGFDFAKDLDATQSLTRSHLEARDTRLIPPEDLVRPGYGNPRMSDIFQLGILCYRIVEDGEWPFADVQDYYTGDGTIRPMVKHCEQPAVHELRQLITNMLSLKPADRPNLLLRVEDDLRALVERTS